MRATALLQSGRPDEAAAGLERMRSWLGGKEKRAEVLLMLARVYLLAGDQTRASEMLRNIESEYANTQAMIEAQAILKRME
jgi:TolA-binding protein